MDDVGPGLLHVLEGLVRMNSWSIGSWLVMVKRNVPAAASVRLAGEKCE